MLGRLGYHSPAWPLINTAGAWRIGVENSDSLRHEAAVTQARMPDYRTVWIQDYSLTSTGATPYFLLTVEF